MTILVYKDGRWHIDNEQPLEGVSLDNLAAILANPSDGDVIKYDEAGGLWTAGKVDALPPVDSSDNGKVLAVQNGAWAASEQGKKFIVTLTPTALDYSGTMDKTVEEITAAYEAGQEIVFDIPSMSARINATQFLEVNEVIRAGGMVFYNVNSSPVVITLLTSGDDSTYLTQIFAMTPAS